MWVSAHRFDQTSRPPAPAPLSWLAHPYWAGLGVILSTVLALAALWLSTSA
jgi:hypothetical protein